MIPSKTTLYGKQVYRSILEARWAVFLDHLGVSLLYEPRTYELPYPSGTLWYKPDGWIETLDAFIEIKPMCPENRQKMRLLARHTRKNVYTFYGEVAPAGKSNGALLDHGDDRYVLRDGVRVRISSKQGRHEEPLINAYGRWSGRYGWYECLACHGLLIGSSDPTIRGACACPDPLVAPHSSTSPRLLAAYQAANAHRFVHPRLPALVA